MEFRLITTPLHNEILAYELERDDATRQMLDWKQKLAWFDGFKLEDAVSKLRKEEQAGLQAQATIHKQQHGLIGPAAEVKELMPKAAMGLNPRYWFSSERSIAKRQLKEAQQSFSAQEIKVALAETEYANRASAVRDMQNDVIAARSFDPLLAKAAVASLEAMIKGIESQLVSLRQRSDALDQELSEPSESLREKRNRLREISRRLRLATTLEEQLEQEHFDRRQIHDRCREELDDKHGNPRNVRIQCERELRPLERDIQKLDERIEFLIRRATRDIQHVIVDGNNMCYEGEHFIGLAALEVLVPFLALHYKVTLIFDPGIRGMTSLKNEDIGAKFPQAHQVHIVAHNRTADETILSVAGDNPASYVLSNDRFVDYPGHSVVKHERLLRHAIVNQTVFVHDLRIDAKFGAAN